MLVSQICGINDSWSSHYPVGNSSKIFNKIDIASHLLVGGSSYMSKGVRGSERNREVIIFR
jgi:hypothetical protein